MDIFNYLDKESPEITQALLCGFRKNDADAVGRALCEEIRARKLLVRVLTERLIQCEKEFPGIKEKLSNLDSTVKGVENVVEPAPTPVGETDRVTDARLDAIDERISIIASGLVTIVNSLSS